jgi:hypothetical protein
VFELNIKYLGHMKTVFTGIFGTLIIFLIGNSSCSIRYPYTKQPMNKTQLESRSSLEFVSKISNDAKGEKSIDEEWYVRLSVQDYFIKWCECGVTQKEVEKLLAKQTGMIKTLEVDFEIKSGDWDNCDPNVIATSRTGKYVIINNVYPK